jgi:hypothetical protein
VRRVRQTARGLWHHLKPPVDRPEAPSDATMSDDTIDPQHALHRCVVCRHSISHCRRCSSLPSPVNSTTSRIKVPRFTRVAAIVARVMHYARSGAVPPGHTTPPLHHAGEYTCLSGAAPLFFRTRPTTARVVSLRTRLLIVHLSGRDGSRDRSNRDHVGSCSASGRVLPPCRSDEIERQSGPARAPVGRDLSIPSARPRSRSGEITAQSCPAPPGLAYGRSSARVTS